MNSFSLRRATYLAKAYDYCVLRIDESAGQLELLQSKKKRFGAAQEVSLTKSAYGPNTEVRLAGRSVEVNGLIVEAGGEADALAIASLLEKPRTEAKKVAEQTLQQAKEAVQKLLATRGEALTFLSNLRSVPRETLLKLPASESESSDLAGDQTKKYADQLRGGLDALNSTLELMSLNVGDKASDRLSAAVYALIRAQNAAFEGDQGRLEEAKAFLHKLGFEPAKTESVSLEKLADVLLGDAPLTMRKLTEPIEEKANPDARSQDASPRP